MAYNRRQFLQLSTSLTAGVSFHSFLNKGFANALQKYQNIDNQYNNEDFWKHIRKEWAVDKKLINLNNGGVSPCPISVQQAIFENFKYSNQAPSFYMWRQLDKKREPLREKLALLAGANKEEIAINRNSTEGLNSIIFGLNLQKGDEIVHSNQDYPNMINAWKQREKRDGVVIKRIDLTLPEDNDDVIVKAYTDAFTSKTKVVQITHIINWTGQIIPVRKIADIAHARGIEVILDAAHSFAQLDFTFEQLGADYAATSRHKWLYAPFGSGMLYIKKEKINNVWALLSNNDPDSSDIRKFESLGTRSFASEMAIHDAVDFHNLIGIQRKKERLIYLKQYWTTALKDNPNIIFNTTLDPTKSCAIANIALKNIQTPAFDSLLFKNGIHVTNIDWPGINGVRITPNLYTSLSDLDTLISVINKISKQ